MDKWLQGIHIQGVQVEPWAFREPFLDLAERFAPLPGTVLLMSGGDLDCARYHILGVLPWLVFKGRHREISLEIDGKIFSLKADAFDVLGRILEACRIGHQETALPISAGLMGYFSYDLKDLLEILPRTSVDDLGLPHICLFCPSIILVHDKRQNQNWRFGRIV